jgi:hypothetical protein
MASFFVYVRSSDSLIALEANACRNDVLQGRVRSFTAEQCMEVDPFRRTSFYTSSSGGGAKPRRIVFSVTFTGTMNCSR